MKINRIGMTSYLEYGLGGKDGREPIVTLDGIKLVRFFLDLREYAVVGGEVKISPNYKWRYIDKFMEKIEAAGITPIFCLHGPIAGQNIQGNSSSLVKLNPIDDNLDWEVPENWYEYAAVVKAFVAYYGERIILQDGNELNFPKKWSNAARTMGPKAAAARFYAFYQAAREMSADIELISGSILSASAEWLDEFVGHFKTFCTERGHEMPTDFSLSWHIYSRESSFGQERTGDDTGASYESAGVRKLGEAIEAVVYKYNLDGHYCTETGWSAHVGKQYYIDLVQTIEDYQQLDREVGYDYNKDRWGLLWPIFQTSGLRDRVAENPERAVELYRETLEDFSDDYFLDTSANAAPIQEGMNQLESQAELTLRAGLILGSLPKFKGVTFWHCANNYDGGAFKNGGMTYKNDAGFDDWTPKPVYDLIADTHMLYGDYDIVNYQDIDGLYMVDLIDPLNSDNYRAVWTDGTSRGAHTPEVTLYPHSSEEAPVETEEEKRMVITKIEINGVVVELGAPIVAYGTIE